MRKSSVVIIYVPGLGDRYDPFRRLSLRVWRLWGARAILAPMTWYDGQKFGEKIARLEKEIAKHKRVILVGESAGASAVLHVAKQNLPNVERIVTLCGVCTQSMPIARSIERKGPGFYEATRSLPAALPLEKLRCYYASIDPVVSKKYSSVPGAAKIRIKSSGHFTTIALCLTLYAPWFVRSIQKD